MKRIALFFGSFNPIHIGHLALANYIAEYADVDEVRFIVSPHNPLKASNKLIADDLRLKWVEKATKNYAKFTVSDIEFHLKKPSYTYQTLCKLKELEPENEFTLIMGADNLDIFNKWKNYDQIINDFNILVYPRLGFSHTIPNEWSKKMKIIKSPIFEISATFIRDAIKGKKDVKFFLPQEIYEEVKNEILTLSD